MRQINKWIEKLNQLNVFFITADVKRGIGFEDLLPNYHIVCARADPIISVLKKQGANIFCLEGDGEKIPDRDNNAGRILAHQKVQSYIHSHSRNTPYIAYFKPSPKLDSQISCLGYNAVGNSSEVNERFENKINAYSILTKTVPSYTIPSVTGIMGNLIMDKLSNDLGSPFIIQFGHGWAGKTTFLVHNENEFQSLRNKFNHTTVRASKFINGLTILNNCCIYRNVVFVGPPALQITGIRELDDNPFATCGRQWCNFLLDKGQMKTVSDISKKLGYKMMKEGFRGYFGIDFIVEKSTHRIYVSEINARMTASTPFYTKRELAYGLIPLLCFHYGAFTDTDFPSSYYANNLTGSQVIVRNSQTASNYDALPAVGTYDYVNDLVSRKNKAYHPERLERNQFILLRRTDGKVTNSEKIRMETKDPVVDSDGKPLSLLKKFTTNDLF